MNSITTTAKQRDFRGLEWGANCLLICGGILISVSPSIALAWPVFIFFLLGHAIWALTAKYRQNNPLLYLNATLMLLDSYAVIVRFPL